MTKLAYQKFFEAMKKTVKPIGSVAGKVFAPLFIGMEAAGAAKKAVQPIAGMGPARNLTQTWRP
jgi:hypothetical protein